MDDSALPDSPLTPHHLPHDDSTHAAPAPVAPFGTPPPEPVVHHVPPAVLSADPTPQPPAQPNSLMPQPVVRVLSPRGLEYVFMTIALLTAAFALIIVLVSLVNGQSSFSVLAFPVAALVVSLPVFAWLFLRLKKAELNDPNLRLDPSKRRSTQFVQVLTFVACLFAVIGFVTALFEKLAGQNKGSLLKFFLDVLVIVLVAGGILAYYWRDEHRS